MTDLLSQLADVLDQRHSADPKDSYVASLYAKGTPAIVQKIGEEATETIIAAVTEDNEALLGEVADLWFHSMVLLSHKGLRPEQVLTELARRQGISGHAEKAARQQ